MQIKDLPDIIVPDAAVDVSPFFREILASNQKAKKTRTHDHDRLFIM